MLMADQRLRTGRTSKAHAYFRPAWKFPPGIQRQVEAVLAHCPAPVLNVCAGSSRLGDVKVDLCHPAADVRADARALPFPDRSFGTVFIDPPYRMPGNDLVERQHVVSEAGRVVRDGGVLLLHAPWMPAPCWAQLEDVWVRHQARHRLPGPAVLLTKWRAKMGRPRATVERGEP
jgi:SAM-dependent methyltransferase